MNKHCLAIYFALVLSGCLRANAATYKPVSLSPPAPSREFRGAWVATVGNIDWPSRPDLTTAEQKAELVNILDQAARLKMNAIIFQVRPACDALYASKLEPWSEYLTGTMGKAPSPFYDPLAFAVEEAHRRGLELHAWFNPYRALHPNAKSAISAGHISKTHPELVRRYGQYLWLDPGEPKVQEHSLAVVMDVLKRYDVDGIHFDDYFYPYAERGPDGRDLNFPDDASWKKFGAQGKLNRDDWRRQNVNAFIERVHRSVKAAKPWVKFGVSPFGIWRPGYPEQIRGYDAYDKLYADSRKWLREGWVDYFAPQLYWSIAVREQSFPALLNWWDGQNPKQRHIWPGMDTTKVSRGTSGDRPRTRPRTSWPPEEIVAQIRLAEKQPVSAGHIHWNMRSLMRSGELQAALTAGPYAEPALMPACPWMVSASPARPKLSAVAGSSSTKLSWSGPGNVSVWLLQWKVNGHWRSQILPAGLRTTLLDGNVPELIALSAVDRVGNQGAPAVLELRR